MSEKPTVDAVESAAMHGDKMPQGLTIFDQLRYHGLNYVYHNYKRGVIDRETASEYKRHFVAELDRLREQYDFAIRCYTTAAERYKVTEAAVTTFAKDKSIEHAEAIIAALHGLDWPQKGEING